MNFSEWLKTKNVAGIFAIIALFSGFFFMRNQIIGNVILNMVSSLNLLAIIGASLIFCSIILGLYSLKYRGQK